MINVAKTEEFNNNQHNLYRHLAKKTIVPSGEV